MSTESKTAREAREALFTFFDSKPAGDSPNPVAASSPTIRIRIEHSRTQRDGWGYSSTVEVTSDDTIDPLYIQVLLASARFLGEEERDIRNQRDAARREGVPTDQQTAA